MRRAGGGGAGRRAAGDDAFARTLIDSDGWPELADIIGNPKALHELERMGLIGVTFWKAVIISKFPGGPRLYWHQDCMMWQDPRAYSDIAPMIFLMYYLEDTSPFNGCLRVLPGSHRRRHPLHDIGEAHTRDINSIGDPDDPRFRDYDGAVNVPVNAGDVVIGDARLLHAAHANRSDRQRTVITIWFYPLFSDLLEPTQRWYHDAMHHMHDDWPTEALAKIAPVIPRYHGSAEPAEFLLWRLDLRPSNAASSPDRPAPEPLPTVDAPLTTAYLDDAWRDGIPTGWSAQRVVLCILDAHGGTMDPEDVISFAAARSERHPKALRT